MPREIGTVASYTCNEGFRYDGGDVTRQCIEQSSMEVIWDGMAGMCVRKFNKKQNNGCYHILYAIWCVQVSALH